jgi:hypothetical protein
MTKQQKIWFWVGVAVAALPEIFWSPVGNLVYSFYQNTNETIIMRPNWLSHSDNINWLSAILFLQFIGLTLATAAFFSSKPKSPTAWVFGIALSLLSLFVLLLFGLSVSLRNIGF